LSIILIFDPGGPAGWRRRRISSQKPCAPIARAGQTVLKVLLAALATLIGFLGWAYWYYRPTVEYAYTDVKLTHPSLILLAVGLLVLGFIAWMVFKK
jgi:hypothetical protein